MVLHHFGHFLPDALPPPELRYHFGRPLRRFGKMGSIPLCRFGFEPVVQVPKAMLQLRMLMFRFGEFLPGKVHRLGITAIFFQDI
jgi:hypothetical protein